MLGVTTFATADYLEAALNACPGHPSGFAVGVLWCPLSQAVASATRALFAQRAGGNPGWSLHTTGTNGALQFGLGGTGGSGSVNSPSATIAATDVGKLHASYGVWDPVTGNTCRLYNKRAQVSSGTVFTSGVFQAESTPPQIGRRALGAVADGVAIYGVLYTLGIPPLATLITHSDSVMANERMDMLPGYPSMCIDFTADINGNGGALPNVFADRGSFGISFNKIGTPGLSRRTARAWSY